MGHNDTTTRRQVLRSGLFLGGAGLALGMVGSARSQGCKVDLKSESLITPGKLIMSTNPTVPPFQYVDENGKLVGMRIELGIEIARRLCLEPEYIRIEFAPMIPGLSAGRWDVINTGIVWKEERSKLMYMVPYERITMALIVPKGNPNNFTEIDDLSGRSVSVEVGTTEELRAHDLSKMVEAKGLAPVSVRIFNSFGDALQAVKSGQVDAQLNLQATADYLEREQGFEAPITGLFEELICLAFRDRALAEAVAGILTDMAEDGAYQKILSKWNATPLSEAVFAIKGPGPQ